MPPPPVDPYDPAFVRDLFEAMAPSYERVDALTSFGFSRRWRRQAVDWLGPRPAEIILDAMAGSGGAWGHLGRRLGPSGRIVAIDLSPGMLRGAMARSSHPDGPTVECRVGDALATDLADDSVDGVLCVYGIKTLSTSQRQRFAAEIARVLRPGGRCALIEVSVPPVRLLRIPYMAYLTYAIPVLGRLLLGDPASYRMLSRYTRRFGDSRSMVAALTDAGLEVEPRSAFFGCATGATGRKAGT
jgi:demethylmenaquinone methyltransferase/2-methoxy-6-polyprenyl-1,4-benzoquinol methylase